MKKIEWLWVNRFLVTHFPLSGDLSGFYKHRLGKYRIIYSFDENSDEIHIKLGEGKGRPNIGPTFFLIRSPFRSIIFNLQIRFQSKISGSSQARLDVILSIRDKFDLCWFVVRAHHLFSLQFFREKIDKQRGPIQGACIGTIFKKSGVAAANVGNPSLHLPHPLNSDLS
jgi:hypothetical protein